MKVAWWQTQYWVTPSDPCVCVVGGVLQPDEDPEAVVCLVDSRNTEECGPNVMSAGLIGKLGQSVL